MKRTLIIVAALLFAGGLGAITGAIFAEDEGHRVLGTVLLQHAAAMVPLALSDQTGESERQTLRNEVAVVLVQLGALRPKVGDLDAYSLEGLCALETAIKDNKIGFTTKELEVIVMGRSYLESVAAELDARVLTTQPVFLRPACKRAQQGASSDALDSAPLRPGRA